MIEDKILTRDGRELTRYLPSYSDLDPYEPSADTGAGFCIGCGSRAEGIPHDGVGLKCDECGRNTVFGEEELMVRGMIRG